MKWHLFYTFENRLGTITNVGLVEYGNNQHYHAEFDTEQEARDWLALNKEKHRVRLSFVIHGEKILPVIKHEPIPYTRLEEVVVWE